HFILVLREFLRVSDLLRAVHAAARAASVLSVRNGQRLAMQLHDDVDIALESNGPRLDLFLHRRAEHGEFREARGGSIGGFRDIRSRQGQRASQEHSSQERGDWRVYTLTSPFLR